MIVESPHAAKPMTDMVKGVPKPAVLALVKANILSLRIASDWGSNLPAEVFSDTAVVDTPASAMHLHIMRELAPKNPFRPH